MDTTSSLHRRHVLAVPRLTQPDEVSCGPTCLVQVLRSFGDERAHAEIDARVERNPDGGTLAVYLGLAALELGYAARLYPLDVDVFDPTWHELPPAGLIDKLQARVATRRNPLSAIRHLAWARFLEGGGEVFFGELSGELFVRILDEDHPIICGLSATWLYREARVDPDEEPDDVGGEPMGHFVVVNGYADGGARFHVCDPYEDVPFSGTGRYPISATRLLNAILLGTTTRDAVLLETWPEGRAG